MDENWLGNIRRANMRDLSNRRELVEFINMLRREDYSFDEIQALLRRAGHDIDKNTIRTASTR
ncbi:MAG: hypothetical protein R3251_01580 [Candidatus Spechtbacterales bacterium]|nr:hypothetical protein [Candidatus Spechtbacterales bacterium]